MKIFNLAEELEKERKKNKKLKELCNKYEEEHKTVFERWKKDIEANKKAIEYIEETWKKESYYEDIENCVEFATINEIQKDRLLNLLKGDNK